MLDLCQNWLRTHGSVLVLHKVVTLAESMGMLAKEKDGLQTAVQLFDRLMSR